MHIVNAACFQTVFNADTDWITAAVNIEIIETDVVNIEIAGTVFAEITERHFAMDTGTCSFENNIVERTVADGVIARTSETDTVAAAVEYTVGYSNLFANGRNRAIMTDCTQDETVI